MRLSWRSTRSGLIFADHNLCTLCRAHEQEKQRGLICYETEFWIETGLVQKGKRKTKFRTTKAPELVFVNSHLNEMACQKALAKFGPQLERKEALCHGSIVDYSSRVSNPDSVDDNGILMLGSGKACRKTALKLCQDALGKHLEDFEASRIVWSSNAANFETYECLLYDRFALGVGEIVHCESYAAPMSRKSFYCIVRYAEDHGEVTYMAKIKFAFRLRK